MFDWVLNTPLGGFSQVSERLKAEKLCQKSEKKNDCNKQKAGTDN